MNGFIAFEAHPKERPRNTSYTEYITLPMASFLFRTSGIGIESDKKAKTFTMELKADCIRFRAYKIRS